MATAPEPPVAAQHAEHALLLTVFGADPGGGWSARLVDTQGRVSEFRSPFELARHLARPPAPGTGLRDGTTPGLR